MKKQIIFLAGIISIFIFLNMAQAQYQETPLPQKVIHFFFRIYNNDAVEPITLESSLGYPTSSEIGDYKVRTISADERILSESVVDILFLYNKEKRDGILVNSSIKEFVDIYLSLPYRPDINRIELYHFENKIYQKEVFGEEFRTDTCGNSFCESWESLENCPQDCSTKTVATTIPRTTTTTPQISRKESKYPPLLSIVFIFLILILILLLVYRMYKQR